MIWNRKSEAFWEAFARLSDDGCLKHADFGLLHNRLKQIWFKIQYIGFIVKKNSSFIASAGDICCISVDWPIFLFQESNQCRINPIWCTLQEVDILHIESLYFNKKNIFLITFRRYRCLIVGKTVDRSGTFWIRTERKRLFSPAENYWQLKRIDIFCYFIFKIDSILIMLNLFHHSHYRG